jgi:hypothetical protein
VFALLKDQFRSDPNALISLYELVGDKDAAAAVTREIMGQPPVMTTDR